MDEKLNLLLKGYIIVLLYIHPYNKDVLHAFASTQERSIQCWIHLYMHANKENYCIITCICSTSIGTSIISTYVYQYSYIQEKAIVLHTFVCAHIQEQEAQGP